MPFKPPSVQPDFSSLVTSLDNSKIQSTNYALYQTIYFLIHNVNSARNLLLNDLGAVGGDLSDILAATIITEADESVTFPNSRRLIAGLGITLDVTIPNQMTVSSTGGGGGGGLGNHYDSPLSDGNIDEMHLISANGECIIVQVPV